MYPAVAAGVRSDADAERPGTAASRRAGAKPHDHRGGFQGGGKSGGILVLTVICH